MKDRTLSGPASISLRRRNTYIFLLILALVAIWIVYELVFVKEEVFIKSESYTFGADIEPHRIDLLKEEVEAKVKADHSRMGNKTFTTDVKLNVEERIKQKLELRIASLVAVEVKDKIKNEASRFQTSTSYVDQISALVHMLECNYYLLYNRHRSMSRYYDFLKVVIHPRLRVKLKNKQSYIRQAGRYLKRKRNLEYRIGGYLISRPHLMKEGKDEAVEVLVLRRLYTDAGIRSQQLVYHFRKHTDNRYYLYFDKPDQGMRYRFIDESQALSVSGSEQEMPPTQSSGTGTVK